jgi:tetratricopeptide (TPR) repeat protein
MKRKWSIFICILTFTFASAQTKVDSLYRLWQDQTQTDSTRANAYYKYIYDGFLVEKPDSAFTLAEELIVFAEKNQFPKAKADAYNIQGVSFYIRRDYSQALDYYQRSLKINEEIDNKKGIGKALSNIGLNYMNEGNFPQALDYYQRSLKAYEETEDKKAIAEALDNVGKYYGNQGNFPQALDYYERSLKINEEIDDKNGIGNTLFIIGIIYKYQGDYPLALDYFQRSLKSYEEVGNKNKVSTLLSYIGITYKDQGDYPQALNYYQRNLKNNEEIDDKKGIADALGNIGNIYDNRGHAAQAIDYYTRSLKIHKDIGGKKDIAISLNNIGIIYHNQGDYSQALDYYQRSLKNYEEATDRRGIANALDNIGGIYKDQDNFPQALDYAERSLKLKEEINDKIGIANSITSIGNIYKEQGNLLQALIFLKRSLKSYEEIGAKNGIARSLNNIGNIYLDQGLYNKALTECQRSLNLSKEIGAIDLQGDACHCLYQAYKGLGNGNKALAYHEQMLVLNDSSQTEETAKKLQRMEFSKQVLADSLLQVEKELKVEMAHQTEVRKKDKNKNLALGAGAFFLLLAGGFYSRWRYVKKSKAVIEKEKDRSENLLLNILPSEIAEELKAKGSADARDFDMVSILFTDFKGFTQASEKLSAKALIEEVNVCFKAFDHICETYKIEKIKTIGDAYMAAGGLPVPFEGSIKNTVLAALEMQAFISNRITEKNELNEMSFKMRLGIHTGPVVAGIVGVKKFQYDIWGDTVSTASRMESSGDIGKVNISESTYALLKDDPEFTFESRGKIDSKGKGKIEMYFVETKLK